MLVVALTGATAVALFGGAGAAWGATTSLSVPTAVGGSATFADTNLTASSGSVSATTDLQTSVQWTQTANVDTSFDPSMVRQGRSVTAGDSIDLTAPTGNLTVNWTLANASASWDSLSVGLGSPTFSASGPCQLMAGGPNYSCSMTSAQSSVIDPGDFVVGSPYVDLALGANVIITPQGLASLRSTTFAGSPGPSGAVTLGSSDVNDAVPVSCSVAPGSDMTYKLGSLSAADGIEVDTSMIFDVGVIAPNPITVVPGFHASFGTPTILIDQQHGTIPISTVGSSLFDFGNVLPNNIPPTADAGSGGTYTGDEGSPITFDGSGSTSACGTPSLVWNFSDGGIAYGLHPQHTFQGPGTFSGQVTATDITGLSSTSSFSVAVADLPPAVSAGPAVTSDWGDTVNLDGSASDPGASQLPLLQYSWEFGDGSGSGGAHAHHVYSTPGTYHPTLTVCDPENMCGHSSTTVTITRRSTTTSYTGPLTSEVTFAEVLQGSIVDDHNQAVIGRPVEYLDGSASTPFAQQSTTTDGESTLTYAFPFGTVGVHHVTVSFPGDALYAPSSSLITYTVTPAPLTVTAVNVTRPYGTPSSLSATLSGFIGGQTLATSDVTGSASCTTPATLTSNPGPYAITCTQGTLSSSNYAFTTYVPATLTIVKAATSLVATATKPTGTLPRSLTMTAKLTSNATGLGIANQTVVFQPANDKSTCTATTNASGVATCTLKLPLLAVPATYTATYSGTIDYIAATGGASAKN